MHLTIVNVIKSLFKGDFLKDPPKNTDNEDHTYIKGDIENRGPCPGLNALANMGYLYAQVISLTFGNHANLDPGLETV